MKKNKTHKVIIVITNHHRLIAISLGSSKLKKAHNCSTPIGNPNPRRREIRSGRGTGRLRRKDMAETTAGVAAAGVGGDGASLKDQGNAFFKAGNYLKAAALYTQAIKLDPSNPTLYSNRAAAFLQLVKLNKALADADTTITLNPQWEKGYFRKGCVFEAMGRYDDAVAVLQEALLYNPQSLEVSKKITKLGQLAKDKKWTENLENIRSNFDVKKYLDPLKSELNTDFGAMGNDDAFYFLVDVMESAIKAWHETSSVDPRVHFLLDKEKTQMDKYSPMVNIDKAFETPHTHSNCFSFLRQYAEESFSKAACLVVPKSIIAYPQVWRGQGSRKWKHGHADGFFVQFESPVSRKLWFVPSLSEKGQTLWRDPKVLDIDLHEVLPRLFKEPVSHS